MLNSIKFGPANKYYFLLFVYILVFQDCGFRVCFLSTKQNSLTWLIDPVNEASLAVPYDL